MSSTIYNTLVAGLAVGVLIALGVAVVSLVGMVVRWKTPARRGHVIRLVLAVVAVPCSIGAQQALLWLVYLPALGREQMVKINAERSGRVAASSLVNVGDRAPDFTLTTADGEEFSLADARGQVVVINFFATWCGPCQLELPHIERIWQAHGGNANFRLLVVGREESLESVRQYRAKNGFSFPIAADPARSAYSLFARELIPRTLVVSPEGIVAYSQAGFSDADLVPLEAEIDSQLAGLAKR